MPGFVANNCEGMNRKPRPTGGRVAEPRRKMGNGVVGIYCDYGNQKASMCRQFASLTRLIPEIRNDRLGLRSLPPRFRGGYLLQDKFGRMPAISWIRHA